MECLTGGDEEAPASEIKAAQIELPSEELEKENTASVEVVKVSEITQE